MGWIIGILITIGYLIGLFMLFYDFDNENWYFEDNNWCGRMCECINNNGLRAIFKLICITPLNIILVIFTLISNIIITLIKIIKWIIE